MASLQTCFISRAKIQQTTERMTIYWDDNRDFDWSDWLVYLSGADIQLVVGRKLRNLFCSYLSSKHAISRNTCYESVEWSPVHLNFKQSWVFAHKLVKIHVFIYMYIQWYFHKVSVPTSFTHSFHPPFTLFSPHPPRHPASWADYGQWKTRLLCILAFYSKEERKDKR